MKRIADPKSRIRPSGLWTVVPVRGITTGKSRLAGVLDPAARSRLNRWLLERTLAIIGRRDGGLGRCVVVSPCEAALARARSAGAVALREPEAVGLNRAARRAAKLAAKRGAQSVLVLPCDLPRITGRSLAALARAARGPQAMVIAPDKGGAGTNALVVKAHPPFEFRFGARSYARHLSLAAERGWTAAICTRADLSFDLDTPADLAAWARSARAGRMAVRPDAIVPVKALTQARPRRGAPSKAPGYAAKPVGRKTRKEEE